MESFTIIKRVPFSRIALLFMAILIVGFGFSLTTAISAHAQSGIPITVESDTSGGKIVGGKVGGFQPGGSGSSSSGKKVSVPIPCVTNAGYPMVALDFLGNANGWNLRKKSCMPEFKIVSSSYKALGQGGSAPWMCPTKTINGFTVHPKGVIETRKSLLQYGLYQGKVYWTYIGNLVNYTCVYPKSASLGTTKAVECIISGHTQFVRNAGAAGKRTFRPTNEAFGTVSEIMGKGKCVTKAKISRLEQPEQADEKNWGNYTLTAYFKKVRCTAATQIFDGTSETLYKGCKPIPNNKVSAKIGLWCGGANTKGWVSNKTWTAADCFNRKYTCDAPAATYDGKTGIVQTLRDGKSRTLKWGTPKAASGSAADSGIRKMKNWEVNETIVNGSSPWDTSVGISNKSKQLFFYGNGFGSWKKMNNSVGLGFYSASNPGKTFQIQRKIQFQAEVRSYIFKIANVNPDTGSISYTKSSKWVASNPGEYLKCTTKLSPKIQAIRTIGDSS